MGHHVKKAFSILGLIFLALVLVLAGFTAWFYAGPVTPLKEQAAKILPYPAAMVAGRPILLRDVLKREAAASSTPDEILAEMIAEQQTSIVAEKYGIGVSEAQLDNELARLQAQPAFTAQLQAYALNENDFKNNALKPQLLYTNLVLWFNGQRALNPDAYALASQIQAQLAQNTGSSTFASLARQYSQDGSTKDLDGNLGFVEINSLWPEFQGAVESAGPGSVVLAPGRDGLYLFYIQTKDNSGPGDSPRAELSEIYLPTSNFNTWYAGQVKNIKIKKLI